MSSKLAVKAFVELLGTLVFLGVILSQGQAIPIAVALAAVIFLGGGVSGGHFNPAVTFMQLIGGHVNLLTAVVYVVAQLLGAGAAYGLTRYVFAPAVLA